MLVFIDESGDPGFKVATGSTPVFALLMVIFADHLQAARAQRIVAQARGRLGVKPEFKFNKCRADIRDAFFDAVGDCPFRLRGLVIDKRWAPSADVLRDAGRLYSPFLDVLMRFDDHALVGAKVVIDGSGNREFKRDLGTHILRHARPGAVSQVRLRNSRSEPLLQLADMCVGAIARSYRSDRPDRDRWRRRLDERIDDLWELK